MANSVHAGLSIDRQFSYSNTWLHFGLATVAAAMIGVLIALPSGHPVLLAAAGCVWFVVWSLLWRPAFFGLFLFLPVAAVPGLLLQQQGWPTLFKDALFLLPGYVGLTLALMRTRTFSWPLPAFLTFLLTSLVIVVSFQAFRLLSSVPLVALIGLRSWLLYLPLVLVPSYLFDSIRDIRRFFHLLIAVSFVPALIGVLEFGLIVLGHGDLAYQWYGSLGTSVSQGFAQVGVADQILVQRVPSTFTFVTQFVAYCLVMTPICLVVWMSDPSARWRQVAALASIAIVAAGFASGSRTFYAWGPIEIGLMLVLMNRGRVRTATTVLIAIPVMAFAIGVQLLPITAYVTGLGWDYLFKTQAAEFPAVFQVAGFTGVGVGIDTSGSRYVLPSQTLPFGIEGWYALAFLELGLPGLILIVCTWLVLLKHVWHLVRTTRDSAAGPIAVCVFVILAATVINLYKGVSLQFDPLNVYLWFVVGIALAIAKMRPAGHAETTT